MQTLFKPCGKPNKASQKRASDKCKCEATETKKLNSSEPYDPDPEDKDLEDQPLEEKDLDELIPKVPPEREGVAHIVSPGVTVLNQQR